MVRRKSLLGGGALSLFATGVVCLLLMVLLCCCSWYMLRCCYAAAITAVAAAAIETRVEPKHPAVVLTLQLVLAKQVFERGRAASGAGELFLLPLRAHRPATPTRERARIH